MIMTSALRVERNVAAHESAIGPILPIGDVRFDGEFRTDSRLVVLTSSFVEIDPERSFSHGHGPKRTSSFDS
jgi:hypothetical protein